MERNGSIAPKAGAKKTLHPPFGHLEPDFHSGAKDARTPDASRGRSVPGARASVWSAGVFSAAFRPTNPEGSVQRFNVRTPSGNSLLIGWEQGWGEGRSSPAFSSRRNEGFVAAH